MKTMSLDFITGELTEREMTPEEEAAHLADLASIMPAPVTDPLSAYNAAIYAMLDTKAQEKGYDSVLTIATYRDSTNPQWKAEYTAFFEWRDRVLTYCYQVYERVADGRRSPIPTIDEFVTEVSTTVLLVWPVQFTG